MCCFGLRTYFDVLVCVDLYFLNNFCAFSAMLCQLVWLERKSKEVECMIMSNNLKHYID